ncbi:MurR/RpiR family transcriptional regulator [Vagococcus zengguangii]|uniref:MurR/RpiR family transcriptional regulator n=1 Tax=Vagococcus zengguangii TaxID=2571750 RepID=A0A4D7CST9_9ENTE|nr:MurR/RpiR family transcriptional regulator [Vagococcus zengguangii]QCI87239.1 MurR/RpiR family transcriptional regulator [Vagococcus zengguangii]TLG80743.1 MurR/RpiR family transcriptional regulator [Vagococcus zengguangii]
MNILQIIENKYLDFSIKEKKIADYLLQNAEEVKNINISVLAKETGSSPATITRFSKKVGVDSFVELKMLLNSHKVEDSNAETINETEIANEILKYYTKVIEETKARVDYKKLEEAVNLIRGARNVYIYGLGNSGLTAQEFSYRLMRMGLSAKEIVDPHIMLMNDAIIESTDVIIVISSSGETPEIIKALTNTNSSKSKIISLTSFSKSTLADISDIVLLSYYSRFINNERFVNSQFATIYVVDIITTLLLDIPEYREKMNKTIEVVTK